MTDKIYSLLLLLLLLLLSNYWYFIHVHVGVWQNTTVVYDFSESHLSSQLSARHCECSILRRTSWTQGCIAHTCVRPRRSTGPVPGSIRRRRDRTGDTCWVRPGQALHLSPRRAVAVVNTHTHTKLLRDMRSISCSSSLDMYIDRHGGESRNRRSL